jgi:hypothetical protein
LILQPEKIGDGNALEDEVLSRDSLPRQLGDQMTLCKSYAVIAKENNNLPLAWHLSAQIRAAQELLSLASPISSMFLPSVELCSLAVEFWRCKSVEWLLNLDESCHPFSLNEDSEILLFFWIGCYSRHSSHVG